MSVGQGHDLQSGTSFAAAHITGIVALLLELDPQMSAAAARVAVDATLTAALRRLGAATRAATSRRDNSPPLRSNAAGRRYVARVRHANVTANAVPISSSLTRCVLAASLRLREVRGSVQQMPSRR